jgi:hypothetical protein
MEASGTIRGHTSIGTTDKPWIDQPKLMSCDLQTTMWHLRDDHDPLGLERAQIGLA